MTMIDYEVLRLRRLRNTALAARAVAAALDSNPRADGSRRSLLSCRSAASCWRIARVITGWVRAHPDRSYQQGPGRLRSACHRFNAGLRAAIARFRGRSLQTLAVELQRLVRELDDARTLPCSAPLSDAFGRRQAQIRKLITELYAARDEAAPQHETALRVEASAGARTDNAGRGAANWPYLAF